MIKLSIPYRVHCRPSPWHSPWRSFDPLLTHPQQAVSAQLGRPVDSLNVYLVGGERCVMSRSSYNVNAISTGVGEGASKVGQGGMRNVYELSLVRGFVQ